MPARGELASPQLEDAEGARLAIGRSRRGEADDRVRDREFRRDADLILCVLAYPQRGGRNRGEAAGEVVQELAKLGPLRVRRQCLEAVDDDQPRAALLDQLAHLLDHTVEAPLVEHPAEIVVEDGMADR